jgi:hypothetical protein
MALATKMPAFSTVTILALTPLAAKHQKGLFQL